MAAGIPGKTCRRKVEDHVEGTVFASRRQEAVPACRGTSETTVDMWEHDKQVKTSEA
jgi:hypothetical protein